MKKLILHITLAFLLLFVFGVEVNAHSGRTNSSGCHNCNVGSCAGTYHCHNSGSSGGSTGTYIQQLLYPTSTPIPTNTPRPTATPTPIRKNAEVLKELLSSRQTNKLLLSDLILSRIRNRNVIRPVVKTVDPFEKFENPFATPTNEQTSNQPLVTPTPTSQPLSGFYQVLEVVDGDTIRILYEGKNEPVRILAIDTPETRDPRKEVQCFGQSASEKMKEFVGGKQVRLEPDKTQPNRDKYQRLLRYVYLEDGTDVGGELVKQGYAFAYTRFPSDKLDEYREYERQAREQSLGLWSSCEVNENGTTKSTNPA